MLSPWKVQLQHLCKGNSFATFLTRVTDGFEIPSSIRNFTIEGKSFRTAASNRAIYFESTSDRGRAAAKSFKSIFITVDSYLNDCDGKCISLCLSVSICLYSPKRIIHSFWNYCDQILGDEKDLESIEVGVSTIFPRFQYRIHMRYMLCPLQVFCLKEGMKKNDMKIDENWLICCSSTTNVTPEYNLESKTVGEA